MTWYDKNFQNQNKNKINKKFFIQKSNKEKSSLRKSSELHHNTVISESFHHPARMQSTLVRYKLYMNWFQMKLQSTGMDSEVRVGILCIDISTTLREQYGDQFKSYIRRSYAEFVEASKGKFVPILLVSYLSQRRNYF